MSVTYTASLPVSEDTVVFVSALLHAERRRLGTRAGTRSLGCYRQAILVLRWLLDGTRIIQLAADNQVSRSTGYAYLHEALTVIAEQAPGLSSVLLAAKMAGYAHVNIDGTLIETDGCRIPGPTPGVDLWWSGKHDNHGGNVQVITAPDGWPLWTSPVRPGREHDTTALRTHDILPLLTVWTDDDLRVLGDLGYEGEQATITVAFKKPKNRSCTTIEQQFNRAHNAVRAIGERGNSSSKRPSKPYATSASARGPSPGSPPRPS
jgi:DDE superfamily endonuclease